MVGDRDGLIVSTDVGAGKGERCCRQCVGIHQADRGRIDHADQIRLAALQSVHAGAAAGHGVNHAVAGPWQAVALEIVRRRKNDRVVDDVDSRRLARCRLLPEERIAQLQGFVPRDNHPVRAFVAQAADGRMAQGVVGDLGARLQAVVVRETDRVVDGVGLRRCVERAVGQAGGGLAVIRADADRVARREHRVVRCRRRHGRRHRDVGVINGHIDRPSGRVIDGGIGVGEAVGVDVDVAASADGAADHGRHRRRRGGFRRRDTDGNAAAAVLPNLSVGNVGRLRDDRDVARPHAAAGGFDTAEHFGGRLAAGRAFGIAHADKGDERASRIGQVGVGEIARPGFDIDLTCGRVHDRAVCQLRGDIGVRVRRNRRIIDLDSDRCRRVGGRHERFLVAQEITAFHVVVVARKHPDVAVGTGHLRPGVDPRADHRLDGRGGRQRTDRRDARERIAA